MRPIDIPGHAEWSLVSEKHLEDAFRPLAKEESV